MFYYDTSDGLNWYKVEARRIDPDKLFKFYTAIGGNIIGPQQKLAQIILTNDSGSVEIHFTSPSGTSTVRKYISDHIGVCSLEPLESWVKNNTVKSVYQIKDENHSNEVDKQVLDVDINKTMLKYFIDALEAEINKERSRLICISIMADYVESDDVKTDDEIYYLCCPVELITDSTADPLLDHFSQLSTSNHTFTASKSKLEKAVKMIYHGAMPYRGKSTISFIGEDLKIILKKQSFE